MSSELPTRLAEAIRAAGRYPAEAFIFVEQGLAHTVHRRFGDVATPGPEHHISGQDLCRGLRDLALQRWGLMAPAVLHAWHVTTTLDFGRIVFAMIEHDMLQKTDRESVDDFRDVFDFATAFDAAGYAIERSKP